MQLKLLPDGTAEVVFTDGNQVTLVSDRPFPPGSTLEGQHEGSSYRVKVRGSRRVEEAGHATTYRVEGRWVSLSRAQRQAVLDRVREP
jgi:hypothetical protein